MKNVAITNFILLRTSDDALVGNILIFDVFERQPILDTYKKKLKRAINGRLIPLMLLK